MNDRHFRKWMSPAVFLGLLLPLAGALAAAEFSEDFETALPGKHLDGQGEWIGSQYGSHPAGLVVSGEDGQNATVYLKSPGGGDHYNVKPFSEAMKTAIQDAAVVTVSAVCKSGCGLRLGGMSIRFGERMAINAGDARCLNGMTNNEFKGTWHEAVVVFERNGDGGFSVHAGRRAYGAADKPFVADPLIEGTALRADELNPAAWSSVMLRLDGDEAVDDVRIATCEGMERLSFAFDKTKKLETAFSPILDHLLPPRTAMDLDGAWEAAPAPASLAEPPAVGWMTCLVPDTHSGLFNGKNDSVWFRTKFTLEAKVPGMRYAVCFERVTDSCELFLNGAAAGSSDDSFFPFRIDVTDPIKAGGNELLVKVRGCNANQVPGRRPQGLNWLIGSFQGIPYPVHLESSGAVSIEDVFVISRLDPSPSLETRIEVRNNSPEGVEAVLSAATQDASFRHAPCPLSLQPGESKTLVLKDDWPNPRLWWPHDPQLYNLDVAITADGRTIDARRQRFGFREVRVVGPDMFINGVKALQRRSSTLAYWNTTTDEWQRKEIGVLRGRGYNGYRMHLGASPRIARISDELGWLVAPEGAICDPHGDGVLPEFWPAAQKHVCSMVRAMRNNPSVLYWCLSNEFACYYMKGTPEEKDAVDAHMVEIGNAATATDPTRIWTCSGDGELGGNGKHGPAPALSLHYGWQPSKLQNTLPLTAYWLDEGLKPWQGIAWDRTKPIILSEDLFLPYCFSPPGGMTQWAGDQAYDLDKGVYEAWFDAYRMLADGYYHAGVSVWNPWGTGESSERNPLYALGNLMPDYLVAVKELNRNLAAGTPVSRTVFVYNRMFRDIDGVLSSQLRSGDKEIESDERSFILKAGERQDLSIDLKIPAMEQKGDLTWDLTLRDAGGATLFAKTVPLVAYPAMTVTPPAGCALLAEDDVVLSGLAFPGGRFRSLGEALDAKPLALVVAAMKIEGDDAVRLHNAVAQGLKVLWLEAPPSGSIPAKTDAGHYAAFAFVRAPDDPAVAGFDGREFQAWGTEHLVSRNTLIKPEMGNVDIILDCGSSSGMTHTPLLRVHCGAGYYLLCQLPVVSTLGSEPAAPHVLAALLRSLAVPHQARRLRPVLARPEDVDLKESLGKAGILVAEMSGPETVLLVDGRKTMAREALDRLAAHCKDGGTAMISGLDADNAARLSEVFGFSLALSPLPEARQLLRLAYTPITVGLSNDDLFWYQGDDLSNLISTRMRGNPFILKGESVLDGELRLDGAPQAIIPFAPCGMAIIPVGQGRLIVSTIKWERFLGISAVRARRFIGTILHNAGCLVVDDKALMEYRPIDLRLVANRGFWNRPERAVTGWFGDAKDDLRYFPVNVTGNDPELNMPQPPEKFPQGLLNYAGVDFLIADPEANEGKSCVAVDKAGPVELAVGSAVSAVWMLGALDKMQPAGTPVVTVVWRYEDGSTETSQLQAGVDLNGYQYPTEVSRGLRGWIGKTPSRRDAVLWCWSAPNPAPEKPVKSLRIEALTDARLGLVGASLETAVADPVPPAPQP